MFGRMRIGGNIIWAADFREDVNTTSQGGGKGSGPKVTTTEYLYFASFAVALCEGEITGIGRVWADDNPEAKRGWRAAVADVLVDRVTRNRAGEEIKSGQVVSVYNQHRDTLAKVFSRDDMKALDEVHNLVRMLDQPQAAGRAPDLGGSRLKDPISLVQAGLIASGRDMITTTIIVARLNFAARFLGLSKLTTPHKVNEVLMRMQFDPDLATAILNRPVAEGTGATWSRDVQKMLASGAAGREASEEDETVDLIMSDQ